MLAVVLLTVTAGMLLVSILLRIMAYISDRRHDATTVRDALEVASRAVLAVPLSFVGLTLIYGFGAGYFSRFWLYAPTPYNLVVSALLCLVLLLALFFFVVPDPGPRAL